MLRSEVLTFLRIVSTYFLSGWLYLIDSLAFLTSCKEDSISLVNITTNTRTIYITHSLMPTSMTSSRFSSASAFSVISFEALKYVLMSKCPWRDAFQ